MRCPAGKRSAAERVILPIRGKKYWLWRAVDSNGDVLDILVQSRCNKRAADKFFRKLFKQFGILRVVITDKLGSYGAALKGLAPNIDHRSNKGLNNRFEGSHRPTRKRERPLSWFVNKPLPGNEWDVFNLQVRRNVFSLIMTKSKLFFAPRHDTLSTQSYRHARTDAHGV
jgi:putative transposase